MEESFAVKVPMFLEIAEESLVILGEGCGYDTT